MAKKQTGSKKLPREERAVIYLEAPLSLKEKMDIIARQHNRSLTGECIQALQEYAARHEEN
jgi:hypothetical protein